MVEDYVLFWAILITILIFVMIELVVRYFEVDRVDHTDIWM